MKKNTLLLSRLTKSLLTFLIIAGNTFSAKAQLRIAENFDINPYPSGWNFTAGSKLGVPGCMGNAFRKNFNSAPASITTPNYEGVSNGTSLTVSFDYKFVHYYSPTTPVGPGWGSITAEYSVNNGTTWTLAFTVNDANHTTSLDCATKSFIIPAANLPVGANIKLRFTSSSTANSNYYTFIDNIEATQEYPVCGGTPNIGATIASANAVSNAQDAATVSISTIPEASGITYQWESSSDNIAYLPISGATKTSLYITGINTNTWYRCIATCTANNLTSISSPKQILIMSGQPTYAITRTSGNTFNTITNTGNAVAITEDVSAGIEIGFGFNFMGKTYGSVQVSKRGFITFAPDLTQQGYHFAQNNISDTVNFPKPLIAPFWENIVSAEEVKYAITGTAPNRQFIIEWKDAKLSYISSPIINLNYQVRLYEGSNNIEFAYGNMDGNLRVTTGITVFTYIDYDYTVGLRNSATNYISQQVASTDYFSNTTQQNALKNPPECNSKITFIPSASFTAGSQPLALPPVNDNSNAAIVLPVNIGPCESLCGSYYSSANATASPESSSCSPAPDDDVWFTFNVTNTAPINIRVVGSDTYTPIVSVMDASFVNVGSYGCVNARLMENIAIPSLAPGQYYIRIHCAGAGSGSSGRFGICVSSPPLNDACSGAVVLTPTNGFPTNPTLGNLAGATPSGITSTGVTCNVAGDNNDVWFSVSIPATGNVVVQMDAVVSNSGYSLQALTGTCTNLVSIACNTNGNFIAGNQSITMPKIALTGQTPGDVVYFRVRKPASNTDPKFLISAYDTTSSVCPAISAGSACTVENETIISAGNKNLLRWTPIRNANGEIIAEIFPNGKALGRLTTRTNVNAGPLRLSTSGYYLDRNHTIKAEIQPATSISPSDFVRMRLYVKQSEVNDLLAASANMPTLSNLRVVKNNDNCGNVMIGSAAELTTTAANYAGGHYLEISIPSFSSFYVITTSPLPVSLLSFSGFTTGLTNQLNWQTAEEKDFDHFELQRSADGKTFTKLATITGKGAGNKYQYVDENPFKAKNYYRLKMIDIDGYETVSSVVSLSGSLSGDQVFSLYPNPFKTNLNIEIPGQLSEGGQVKIMDTYGRLVKIFSVSQNRMSVDVTNLQPGIYMLQYWNGKELYTEKLIKY